MIDVNETTPYDSLDYPALANTCKACQACGLSETRTQVVVGTGPVPCNLMIIGEGPGAKEDEQGLPFIGRSGQLLTKILDSVSINRESDVYITNIVKCRPPKNRDPQKDEVAACKPYLIRQIQLVQPKLLLVLGAPALKTVLEETTPISKVRGSWYQTPVNYMDDNLYIMPLFHPSYLLRNDSREKGSPKWLTWHDLKEIKAALSFYEQSELDSAL
ncbi:MAG: uracil-DNA glycosylase [Candidatus Marinamargulisbacteria bacterium]|jgi:uracil-DNA glycosylase|nr:uracil-DNA glycosylase [bacterium]MDG2265229.1 uracil-DNA glycosylase [Candidatus Marinamargulisbacteria bacterium]|tara:strand:- start:2047 stop:2694 length:648 start_codon:yes stop_codon:yes gene_type:complete